MYTGSWHENTYVVTGSSGAGKSEVCKLLAETGAKIVSADELARQALAPGTKELEQVRAVFGERVFSWGALDRKSLGNLIFNNPALKEKLEAITHPKIAELAESAFRDLSKAGAKILVYDCPLFFETKLKEKKFKGIIFVTASEENKIKRLILRDGIDEKTAKQRLSNQLSDKERIPLSDFVIDNNGDLESLKIQVYNIAKQL